VDLKRLQLLGSVAYVATRGSRLQLETLFFYRPICKILTSSSRWLTLAGALVLPGVVSETLHSGNCGSKRGRNCLIKSLRAGHRTGFGPRRRQNVSREGGPDMI
jgi:hypothetical protein